MIFKTLSLLVSLAFFITTTVEAADNMPKKKERNRELLADVSLARTPESKNWSFAAGLVSSWSVREDYGARSFKRFEPELVGFYYTKMPVSKFWLRHAARLGFSQDQPQMPQAVRIEESDYKLSLDESIVFNGVLTPSFGVGAGYNWRQIKGKRENPVVSIDDRLSQKMSFVWYYLQAGVGIPALEGQYLLEPIVRWQHLKVDERTKLAYGFEVTRAL